MGDHTACTQSLHPEQAQGDAHDLQPRTEQKKNNHIPHPPTMEPKSQKSGIQHMLFL